MRYSISDTAQFGDMTRGPRIVTDDTKKEMKKILTEIQQGKFAKEWILENRAGRPEFNALARQDRNHLIEQVGAELRGMMSWIAPRTKVSAEIVEPAQQTVSVGTSREIEL